MVKQAKRHEQGIFGPTQCAIIHDFLVGLRMIWIKKLAESARDAGERPSVVCLYGRGNLGG